MTRKTLTITLDADGRDQGKVFLLREMPPSQAEKWAMRAFLALAKSGVQIPDDISSAGLAGIAALGLKALSGLSFEDAEPLMDEMFSCISIIPDPSRPNVVRALIEDDIEEVSTRLRLRKEVFGLHTNFFTSAAR
ncbi:hypothetical protein PQR71_40165 [Paraburkholderia fungorum]|uniref:hypothetical protein n=1 Tax=Paraburkholderia fungorum TaxID=134537 RepID=UPI0038BD0950